LYSRRSIYDKSGALSLPPDYSGTSMRSRTYLGRGKRNSSSQQADIPVKNGGMPPPEYRRQLDFYPRIPSLPQDDVEDRFGRAPFGDERFYTPDTPTQLFESADTVSENAAEACECTAEVAAEKDASLRPQRDIKSDDILLAALLVLMLGDVERNKETIILLALLFLSAGIL